MAGGIHRRGRTRLQFHSRFDYHSSVQGLPRLRDAGSAVYIVVVLAAGLWDAEPFPFPYPVRSPLSHGECVEAGEVFELGGRGVEPISGSIGNGWLVIYPGEGARHIGLAGFDLGAARGSYPFNLEYAIHGRTRRYAGEVAVCEDVRAVERFGTRFDTEGDAGFRASRGKIRRQRAKLNRVFWSVTPEFFWKRPFASPVEGEFLVTSPFGTRRFAGEREIAPHTGVDLRARSGTPIMAMADGHVALADRFMLEGNLVVLDHGGGLHTYYAHLLRIDVAEGQSVTAGDRLGLAGRTGRARGAHLHLGARLGAARINPLSLLKLGGFVPETGEIESPEPSIAGLDSSQAATGGEL